MDPKNLNWFDNVELRTHPWPGLNWVTTILSVPDVKKARDLYISAFNFVSIFDLPDETGELVTTRLRYRGSNFLLAKEGLDYEGSAPSVNNSQAPIVFYVYVDDTEAAFTQAVNAGLKVLIEPSNTFWGDKRCRLKCPFGYVWDLAQRIVV